MSPKLLLKKYSPALVFRRTAIYYYSKRKISYKELSKNRLDIDQLLHMLRSKDIFSIREVEYAILETDGSLSVLPKSGYTKPTRSDLQLPPSEPVLSIAFVSDGRLLLKNLIQSGFDEDWLKTQLKNC